MNKFLRRSLACSILAIGLVLTTALSSAESNLHAQSIAKSAVFQSYTFGENDAILVKDQNQQTIFEWQSTANKTPASVIKILTALLAIDRWGVDHRFETRFYQEGGTVWVEGRGDPMLVSEELEKLATALKPKLLQPIKVLATDASLFSDPIVPGRGATNDPYNAPLSALSVNFNTVSLRKRNGQLRSGEPQTWLTDTARQVAVGESIGSRAQRVNLRDAETSQQQFAELLSHQLDSTPTIRLGQRVPKSARLIYTHENSNPLSTILRGTLEYSNNFIANQLFLLLGEVGVDNHLTFEGGQAAVKDAVSHQFDWQNWSVVDGAGLSRDNALSAQQIMDVLDAFAPHKELLKKYSLKMAAGNSAAAVAKSGTLTGVQTLAGYLTVNSQQYQFVFLIDRAAPYGYREQLLQDLANDLADLHSCCFEQGQ